MADINWIKLRVDMFDDEKIKIIQSMPEGDAILVIWIRIIALAGKCNAKGLVLIEDEFPYSDEMLATIFNKPLATVRLALGTFEKFRMIERTEKGIYISNFEKHQNTEGMEKIREQARIRKQREREKKRALLEAGNTPALPENSSENPETLPENVTDNVTSHVTSRVTEREVTKQNKNKNKNIYNISSNEDIVETSEKTSEVPDRKSERLSYDEIMKDFHDTCPDLPGIRALNDARKTKIRSLVKELDKLKIFPDVEPEKKLHVIFQAAQNSDFLSGRSGKWNGCSFDWLINKTNALKVLEGQYQNKGGVSNAGRTDQRHNQEDVSGSDRTTNEALERFRRNRTGV
jgi:predicted phage replisome organizer